MGQDEQMGMAAAINGVWDLLEEQVAAEFEKSGVAREDVTFRPAIRMQYYGQLNDLEYPAPTRRIETADDLQAVLDAFNELYGTVYRSAAQTPEFGYLATRAIMTGRVDVEKPSLPQEADAGETPPDDARKPARRVLPRRRVARRPDLGARPPESGQRDQRPRRRREPGLDDGGPRRPLRPPRHEPPVPLELVL